MYVLERSLDNVIEWSECLHVHSCVIDLAIDILLSVFVLNASSSCHQKVILSFYEAKKKYIVQQQSLTSL